MKEIKISIDDSLITSVLEVIEPLDFDIEMVIKILLKRISREKNLDFLLANGKTQEENKSDIEEPLVATNSPGVLIAESAVRDMRKALAISIFRSKGIVFNGNITFASKNRTA